MVRGIGEFGVVSQLPESAIAIAGILTQLGDMWFVLLGVATLYWLGNRGSLRLADPLRDCLYLFALAIGAYALTVVLKHTFALPRPPGAATAVSPSWLPAIADPFYESMVTGDGFGFPSGHALKSAAVYGGATTVLDVWERNRQQLIAGSVIGVVALSRVVLGVHYLVDVVVGVVLGIAFLGVLTRTTGRDPRPALVIAAVLGVLAVGMTMSVKSGLVVGSAAVALGIWEATGSARPSIA